MAAGLALALVRAKGTKCFSLTFSFATAARLSELAPKAPKMTEAELKNVHFKTIWAPRNRTAHLSFHLSASVLCYRGSDAVLPLPSPFVIALPPFTNLI